MVGRSPAWRSALGLLAALGLGSGCTLERTEPRGVAFDDSTARSVASSGVAGSSVASRDMEQGATALNLLQATTPRDSAGALSVVIEIPAGTNDKWEVNKETGALVWEQRDGRPRVVAFLPYPGNYGFVPRTLLDRAQGGDGDPLDVLVLGQAIPRGTVVSARLLGVLRLRDGGEADDKLLAVDPTGPFGSATSLDDVRRDFPGALEIVADWFAAYKGPGVIEVGRFEGLATADSLLEVAITAFRAP